LPLSPFHTPQFKIHYLHRRHQQSRSSLSGTERGLLVAEKHFFLKYTSFFNTAGRTLILIINWQSISKLSTTSISPSPNTDWQIHSGYSLSQSHETIHLTGNYFWPFYQKCCNCV
jgi:hypothetical protein